MSAAPEPSQEPKEKPKIGRPKGAKNGTHKPKPPLVKKHRKVPKPTRVVGRPKIWTAETVETLRLHLLEFSKRPDFFHMCQWHADSETFRDQLGMFRELNSEFSNALKLAQHRAEANVTLGTLQGRLNATMGVFTQKQHGWTDRTEVDSKAAVSGGLQISYGIVAPIDH